MGMPMKPARRELSNQQFALMLALPVILFLVATMAYPMGYALWLSTLEIGFFGGFSSEYVGFANYVNVLYSTEFWRSLVITIRFVFLSVLFSMLIGLGLALLMHRVKRGRTLLCTLIILPWSVSLYGAGVMWQYLSRGQTGVASAVINRLLGRSPADSVEYSLISSDHIVDLLALGNAWNLAPLVAFFILANLSTIPVRLYDLARIDKLSAWQRFTCVTLPPLQYTLFVFTSITLILSMKLLDFIYVMSAGGPGDASATLTYRLFDLAFRRSNYGLSAAMSFYLLALIIGSTLALYFFWGRKLEAEE
jgi:multiple sugar transport system permease protein